MDKITDIMLFKPVKIMFGGAFGIIILLKEEIVPIEPHFLHVLAIFVAHYFHILLPVYNTLNFIKYPNHMQSNMVS